MLILVLFGSVRFETPSFGEKGQLPITESINTFFRLLCHCRLHWGALKFLWEKGHINFEVNHQIAYTEVQNISVVEAWFATSDSDIGLCIRIHVAGTRAPIEVMLDKRMKREAEWLVNQIQARMAAVQSRTVPEDQMRLTKQAVRSNRQRAGHASSTQQTT